MLHFRGFMCLDAPSVWVSEVSLVAVSCKMGEMQRRERGGRQCVAMKHGKE